MYVRTKCKHKYNNHHFPQLFVQFLRIETDPENGFVVKAANRLYVNKDYQLGNVYRREVNEIFHADAQNVDFAGLSANNGIDYSSSIWSLLNRWNFRLFFYNEYMLSWQGVILFHVISFLMKVIDLGFLWLLLIEKRDQVQKSINSFVKERTQGLISDILSSPLPSDTVMALVNALYFKGVWQNEMTEPKLKIQFNAHNW